MQYKSVKRLAAGCLPLFRFTGCLPFLQGISSHFELWESNRKQPQLTHRIEGFRACFFQPTKGIVRVVMAALCELVPLR